MSKSDLLTEERVLKTGGGRSEAKKSAAWTVARWPGPQGGSARLALGPAGWLAGGGWLGLAGAGVGRALVLLAGHTYFARKIASHL